MSLFSSRPFLEALAAVYFPGKPTAVREARLGTQHFRVLQVDGGDPVTQWPFLDFLEPLAEATESQPLRVSYLPKVGSGRLTVEEWNAQARDDSQPSPFVDFGAFPAYEEFEAHCKRRRSSLWPDSRRQLRRLEQQLGKVAFAFHDPRPETLEQCLRWKSAQYLASGYLDYFAIPPHADLFRRLAAQGDLTVTSLSAGDRVVAAHMGVLQEGRFYYWIPAYDSELNVLSPGRLMLHFMLRECYDRGAREFDFLVGDEDYKWHYATHVRRVSALGRPPLALQVRRGAKRALRSVFALSPAGYALAQRLRRRLG